MPTSSKVETRNGRLVSEPTAWWIDRSPNGYTYYCIHNVKLTAECEKCERKVKR